MHAPTPSQQRCPRLLYVITHGRSARSLLKGQLSWMRQQGFEVAVAASPGPELREVEEQEGVTVFPVPLVREIAPVDDLRALVTLVRLMTEWKPDVVNAGTPKAGLLGMMAAWATRVPVRVYTLRGLRVETTTGLKQRVLETTERIASACSSVVVAISESLAREFVGRGLSSPDKLRLVGRGSSKGVEFERFSNPDPHRVAVLRDQLGLPEGAPVIGFVGRFTRDKGILELVEAYDIVRDSFPNARLLLVGRFESGDPVPEETVQRIHSDPGISWTGYVTDSSSYYHLMDVCAFPSYREGFGNVCLEAAAAGLPVVGFRATGTVDAVVDEATGTLVDVGDEEGLASAITRYLTDESLRRSHGDAGQCRARDEFQPERIWTALLAEYDRLLAESGSPRLVASQPELI